MSVCKTCGIEKRDTCHAEYEQRISKLKAEVERARVGEGEAMAVLEGTELKLKQVEAELVSIHALVALQRERTVQAEAKLAALTAAAEALTSLSSAAWDDEALRAVERIDELIGREETG